MKPHLLSHRILIIRFRGLGDLFQVAAMINALQAQHPGLEIALLTLKSFEEIGAFIQNPIRIFTFDPKNSNPLQMPLLIQKIRSFHPDTTLDLFGNTRSALITLFSGALKRVGFNYRGRRFCYNLKFEIQNPDIHIKELFLKILDKAGLGPLPSWSLILKTPPLLEPKRGHLLAQKPIALNCNAAYQAKKWLPEHFKILGEKLLQKGYHLVILIGPGEEAYTRGVFGELLEKKQVQLLLTQNLLKTMGVLSHCRLLVTNDSAPLHMGVACGIPVYALFGPTNPRANGPLGLFDRVFRAESLPCLVCHLEVCSHRSCMAQLQPTRLFDTILENFPLTP